MMLKQWSVYYTDESGQLKFKPVIHRSVEDAIKEVRDSEPGITVREAFERPLHEGVCTA